jgi:hypothetical protein
VEHGAASISGIVIDPFTQQPLANALVGVNGSLVSTLTDGTGHFTLNNVPSGNVSVMVTLPNYGVGKISLAISPNDSITLTDPIQLNALARPPNFGGVLPRAATVASVIDRGVSSKGGGLTLEQAKAVINDTIIAVGGIEFGVMVEAGNQLNPKMEGPGELSLTHEGVGRQPEAMILGDVYTVKDLFFMLKALFSFPLGLTMGEVISGFQRSVDEAWANPGEPGSAMAIVLFNEGNTLSSSPPIITADTRFNRFQLFLLTSSFLVYHRASLEQSTEDVLKAHGVDYESMLPPQKVSKASDASQTRMVPSASDPKPSPAVGDLTAKQTFAKVWRTLGANMIVQAQHAAFEGAKIAMLAQIFIGLTIGITGGRLGMAAAVLDVAAAAVMGATATLVFMTVIGWYIGVVAASFEPEPSGNVESYLDQNGNFVIRFSRSESENNAASQPVDSKLKRDYAYHLYRFQNSSDTVWATGEYMPLEAVDDMKDPNNKKKLPTGRKKFVVPRCLLRAGANHFRIVTFQYYHNSQTDLVEGLEIYDTNMDGSLSRDEFLKGGLGDNLTFVLMDRNHDEKLDATEFKSNPVPMDMEIKPVIPQAPFLRSFGWVKASPTQYQQGLSTASDEVKAKLEAQHRGVRPNISILNQDEFKLSLPDREFVSSNSAAFALVDEPDKVAFSRAKELALLPDAEAKTRINAEAPELARQLYQKHLNVTPTPQQVELVKKVMEVALEGYGMRTQFTTLSQEAAQLNRAVASVKAGTAPPEGIEVNLSLRYDGSCTIPKEVETVKVTSQNVSEIEYQIQNPTKAFNEGPFVP